MSKLRKWLCTSLLTVVATAPVMAGSDDGVPANNGTGTNATAAEPAPSPALNPTSAINNSNVTALLGVLVMKGVLAPSEANAIQGAAPEAEFQLLVEALTRKGLLSAADVSRRQPLLHSRPRRRFRNQLRARQPRSGQVATTPADASDREAGSADSGRGDCSSTRQPCRSACQRRTRGGLQVGTSQDDALRFRQGDGGS